MNVIPVFAIPASFSRPPDTNAYAAGDLVANDVDAADVVPLSWVLGGIQRDGYYITGVRLKFDHPSVTNAQFRVHLYKATPTIGTTGDNGVFGSVVTGYASWIGSFDVTLVALHADGAVGIAVATEGVIEPSIIQSGHTVYGLVEARAAYSPKNAGLVTAELLVEGA